MNKWRTVLATKEDKTKAASYNKASLRAPGLYRIVIVYDQSLSLFEDAIENEFSTGLAVRILGFRKNLTASIKSSYLFE